MHTAETAVTYLVTVETTPAPAGILAETIRSAWGVEPVEIQRAGDSRIWLDIYFQRLEQAMLAKAVLEKRRGVRAVTMTPYRPRDWQRFYRQHVKRRPVGRRLEICPVWEARAPRARGRIRVLINPGMSFGTGDHFTTRFCLEMLEQRMSRKACRSMLDVGAGSGILAIAARKLGCPRVVAVEADPACLGSIRENMAANRIARGLTVRRADVLTDALGGPYDIVCANLYYELLRKCAGDLLSAARSDLIVSGVREQEADALAEILTAQGAHEVARDGNGEWAGLVMRKVNS